MVFEGLGGGIQKPRDVRPRAETVVDELLAERDRVAQSKLDWHELKGTRARLTAQGALLKFTATDLTTLILATANADYDEETWRKVGLYTGVLLTTLTRRDPSTAFHIDLGGGYFPYLFCYAQEVGRLTVTNAHGDFIMEGLAHYGQADSVYASHLTGNSALDMAAGHGTIGQLIASHLTGDWTLYGAADHGTIGQLIATHLTGNDTLCWAAWQGTIGQLVASHITGDRTLHGAANHGTIGQLVASHLTGNDTLREAAWQGTIGQLIASHISGNNIFLDAACEGKIEQLVTYDLRGKATLAFSSRDIRQHRDDHEAEAWLRQHHLDVLLNPLATFDSDTFEALARQLSQTHSPPTLPTISPRA